MSLPPPPRTSRLWASAPGVIVGFSAKVPGAVAVMGLSKLAKGWRKGAVKGNAEDQCRLAECYDRGTEGVKIDLVAAAAWWGKAAEQEHAGAQCQLGICYTHGDGVAQSLELAVTFYRKAADAGQPAAQSLRALCYANGQGMEQNDALAVTWWGESATGGDTTSSSTHTASFFVSHCALKDRATRILEYSISGPLYITFSALQTQTEAKATPQSL